MAKRKGYSKNKMNPLKKRSVRADIPKSLRTTASKPEAYTEQYRAKVNEFYKSLPWQYLRYDVFLRDGRICVLCGATPEDGIMLHVDHIIPLRQDWSLRLKAENLQVLCENCNAGKGSTDITDWRPKRGSPNKY